jgi:hypothetical protein
MRVAVYVIVLAGLGAFAGPAQAADQFIKLSECEVLSTEYLHELATYALIKRRYNIEEDMPMMIVGEQDDLKVEILIEPANIVIRWKEGFGHKNDQWLRNLKTDVLWRLAE